ncbi:EamA/RhaT family transporter, partial [Pseudomonas sp. BJa5]|nr:EamA/RhaT family transporter [Pseudomonas sp. BGr12]
AALALWQPAQLQVDAPLERGSLFWLFSLGCAIFGSLLAALLWNAASKRMQLTLSVQLIFLEKLFALLYAFIWRQSGPSL